MPIADELAALRAKGSVKARATGLASKGGAALSTPEAEAAALKAKKENDKLGSIKAKEILNKGSHASAQASADKAAEFNALKKAELEKKAQASENLKKGGSAGGYSQEMEHTLNQTGKKKAELEKKNETKRAMASGSKGGGKKGGKTTTPPAPQAGKKEDDGKPATVAEVAAVENEGSKEEAPPAAEKSAVVVADDDDDVPDLEEAEDAIPELQTATTQQTEQTTTSAEEAEYDGEGRKITNRNEKKARKMMTRLGMRPVPNIARVTLKAGGGRGYFFIDRPDVFTAGGGGKVDTYVIFGEAKQGGTGGFGGGGGGGNANGAAQAAAAQQQAAAMAAAAAAGEKGMGMPSVQEGGEDVPDLAVAEEGGADDAEDGVEAKDIDLVMSQASCSRAKAVAALKENDGDLVNAIMSLTT
ncbi:hypothetical protein ACHAXR_007508 [Thalassiosira sp. AJA248-18]